jgi:hypothetical protein
MAKTDSKGSYGTIIGITASALVVLAVFVASRLEVYERNVWRRPSAELRANHFYVLGAWLSENGCPVRFYPRWAGIKKLAPRDGGLYLQASLFDWETAGDVLVPWVEEGGTLLISVDIPWYRRDGTGGEAGPGVLALEQFLETLDIRLRRPAPEAAYRGVWDGEAGEGAEDEGGGEINEGGSAETGEAPEEPPFPDPEYDSRISFEDPGFSASGALALRDREGLVRLIRRPLGKGRLTVTGTCFFMYNYYLDNEANARLAWELTGASLDSRRPGFLFVRGRRAAAGFFSALTERGNLKAPVISVLALIVVGFWMVVPSFGIVREDESKRYGAISGRFLAEARFLRRYGACGAYLEAYLRELRRRGGGLGPELQAQVQEAADALASGRRIGPRKLAVYLKNLMSALEQI